MDTSHENLFFIDQFTEKESYFVLRSSSWGMGMSLYKEDTHIQIFFDVEEGLKLIQTLDRSLLLLQEIQTSDCYRDNDIPDSIPSIFVGEISFIDHDTKLPGNVEVSLFNYHVCITLFSSLRLNRKYDVPAMCSLAEGREVRDKLQKVCDFAISKVNDISDSAC